MEWVIFGGVLLIVLVVIWALLFRTDWCTACDSTVRIRKVGKTRVCNRCGKALDRVVY